MDTTSLVMALVPAFAAGFAVQRLLEILDPLADRFIGPDRKKTVLALSSLAAGVGFAGGVGLRVLVHLNTYKFAGRFERHDLVDLLVTGLVISAGTEGFNSILKFMNYKKEEQKAEATTKAVSTVAARSLLQTRALLQRRAVAVCDYTRLEIENIVVGVYRMVLSDDSITKFSRFGPGKEIDIDSDARRAFFFPIKQNVDRPPNCVINKLTPDDVQKAKTVGEVIDAICDEFGIS
jgi:hypothetical protein